MTETGEAGVNVVSQSDSALSEPQALNRNPVLVYLATLSSESGRRAMKAKLTNVAEILRCESATDVPWHSLKYEHVALIRSQLLEQGKAPATINATLAAVRGCAHAAWNLGLMPAEEYQRIKDVKSVKGSRLPHGRALNAGEVIALFGACQRDESPAGVRDAALLSLLLAGGLRRSEVTTLDVADFNSESGALKIRGKGNKERYVYLNNGSADAVADWIALRGDNPGALLTSVSQTGIINEQLKALTDQAIYSTLQKRGKEANVAGFSPHDLRRTFISELLDAGADISAVQQLAGHSSVNTTLGYDRRGEAAKRKAASLLHVPYRRRKD